MGSKKRKGVHSKAKGSRGEYLLRDSLSKWYGKQFRRTPGSGAWGTINSDAELVGDLVCDDPTFPYSIEVKNHEGWDLNQIMLNDKCPFFKWWDQTLEQSEASGKMPLLAMKKNRQEFIVVMRYDDMPNDLCGKFFIFHHQDHREYLIMFPLSELVCCNPYQWSDHEGLHNV